MSLYYRYLNSLVVSISFRETLKPKLTFNQNGIFPNETVKRRAFISQSCPSFKFKLTLILYFLVNIIVS